jgi:hypothetical protein
MIEIKSGLAIFYFFNHETVFEKRMYQLAYNVLQLNEVAD